MRFLRPGLIEVLNRGTQDTMQLLLVQDEQVIQTLSPHTSQKALTDGIGAFRVIRCFQDLDAAGGCHTRKTGSKLVITIANEILRPLSKGSRFPQLLGGPGVGRRASDAHMDDLTRVQINDEEGKQGAKEEVGDLQEITGPDVFGMIVQEGLPGLSSWPCGTDLPHVLLNGPLADVDSQFEQFATNTLCSPQAIVPGHLLDQGHGLLGDPWLERSCPGLVLPKELEALAMPPQERLWPNDEQRLLPGSDHPGQKNQKHPV